MTGFGWDILEFRQPLWLLLSLQPIALLLLFKLFFHRKGLNYADVNLFPWVLARVSEGKHKRARFHLLVLQCVWVLIAVAMAGPRYPDPPEKVAHASGVDIMIVVDVSRSMTATDIKPSRLQSARSELFQLLSASRSDRMGLIVYAGHAHLLSPLTRDHNAVRFYARSIQSAMLPSEGSQLGEAIALANKHLSNSKRKAIVIISDGDSGADVIRPEWLQTPLYILGVGSEAGAPLTDVEGGWYYYQQQLVRTRLDSKRLQELAEKSGGRYITATDDQEDLNYLYYQGISKLGDNLAEKGNDRQTWIQVFQWPLLLAVFMLLMISVKISSFSVQHVKSSSQVILFFITIALWQPDFVHAGGVKSFPQAYAAYQKKDYRQALEIYALLTGFNARMGEGSSAYKLNDYARAITQYSQAFLQAADDKSRAAALYNLGNSFFKVKKYDLAVISFTDALRYQPGNIPAQKNLDFTRSLIASIAEDPFSNQGATSRGGRGPRSMKAKGDVSGGTFSIDDKPEKKAGITASTPGDRNKLRDKVAAGKAQARAADMSVQAKTKKRQLLISPARLMEARRLALQKKQNQTRLWKSLFEDEENYPAPLDQPVELPGVKPW